jgi:adenylate cyclase
MMRDQTQPLILAAEREAQMVSALARLIVVISVIAIFLLFGGTKLPVAPVVLTYLGSYAVISVLSGLFSLKRFFRPWMGILFTAIDGISLAVFVGLVLKITGTPANYFGAVPGFVFIFSVLMLATMRYTVAPIATAVISFSITSLLISISAENGLFAADTAMLGEPDVSFFFGEVQNAARWWFVVTAAVLGFLAVLRRRKMLEAAISLGQKTANLSRYLPDRVAQLVADQGIEALSRGRRQQAAVLFVDIQGFTGISEHTSPEELSALLSEFRSLISAEVEANSGIIDKFIGDAVMAVFGVPGTSPSDAENGLRCALGILSTLDKWNDERQKIGHAPIAVTIGVHFGEVFAGAVGTADRMEFTVLGDTVNIAARLQEVAKQSERGLVVSLAVLDAAGTATGGTGWREMADTSIRGRHGEVPHFSHRSK